MTGTWPYKTNLVKFHSSILSLICILAMTKTNGVRGRMLHIGGTDVTQVSVAGIHAIKYNQTKLKSLPTTKLHYNKLS